jgi:hypothetical protein
MKQKIIDVLVILYAMTVALTYLFITMSLGVFYFIKNCFNKDEIKPH